MKWLVYADRKPYDPVGKFDDYREAIAVARRVAASQGRMYCVRRALR